MQVEFPKSDKYVVAVSGGVDSVVLLHLMQNQPNNRPHLIVAHFDHGIRQDSQADRLHVQELAHQHGLPFVFDEGKLGAQASEATARAARYGFLRKVQQASGAGGIITAHHQDDVLETAILNILRGTGRKGLTSLVNHSGIKRPLLNVSKQELIDYAHQQNLSWREDTSNHDLRYARNYIRHQLLGKFDAESRQQLLTLIQRQHQLNREIDELIINQLHMQPAIDQLDRQWFARQPHDISKEILAMWLRSRSQATFDRKTLERLVVMAKVAANGSRTPIKNDWFLQIGKADLALVGPER